MEIGARIRRLRRRQGRTLQAVARSCGFTKSLLSKIENGLSAPPVATLTRIAAALGVGVSALLDDSRTSGPLAASAADVRKAPLVRTDAGYSFFTFAAERAEKLMQPFLFEVRKGQVKRHRLRHVGEEFVYILSGSIRFRAGRVEYSLGPGDSLYFDSEEEHEVAAVSRVARYLAVFTEPSAAPARRKRRSSRG